MSWKPFLGQSSKQPSFSAILSLAHLLQLRHLPDLPIYSVHMLPHSLLFCCTF